MTKQDIIKRNYYFLVMNYYLYHPNPSQEDKPDMTKQITDFELSHLEDFIYRRLIRYSLLIPSIKNRLQDILNKLRFDETLEIKVNRKEFIERLNQLIIAVNQAIDNEVQMEKWLWCQANLRTVQPEKTDLNKKTKSNLESYLGMTKEQLLLSIASDYQLLHSCLATQEKFNQECNQKWILNENVLTTICYFINQSEQVFTIPQISDRITSILLRNQLWIPEEKPEFFKANTILLKRMNDLHKRG